MRSIPFGPGAAAFEADDSSAGRSEPHAIVPAVTIAAASQVPLRVAMSRSSCEHTLRSIGRFLAAIAAHAFVK
jgi:hypothetical protein